MSAYNNPTEINTKYNIGQLIKINKRKFKEKDLRKLSPRLQ